MKNDFLKDYEDFLDQENEMDPPKRVSNKALAFISSELKPSQGLILGKLVFLQTIMGSLTLLFCPQFNLSLTNSFELYHFFHHAFGSQVCMALCGAIFMGATAIPAAYLLKENEVAQIRKSKFLHFVLLSGLSVAAFILMGAQVYVSLIPFWILGAVLFASLSLMANFKIKKALLA